MENSENSWCKDGAWKARYSKLYSSRLSLPKEEGTRRITLLGNSSTPYTSLLMRMHENRLNSLTPIESACVPSCRMSVQMQPSDLCRSTMSSRQSDDLGGTETLLLNMVRASSREVDSSFLDKSLELRRDDTSENDTASEACMHGLSMRMTERSVSRSRVSRMSTRRDMDIPSLMAFTTTHATPTHLGIPAFQKINAPLSEEIPRWSIRRSVCPVCSQKWRDKSSIYNVKNSGLKRNSSLELPSVIAPARLRSSFTMEYIPRPALAAVDEDAGLGHGGLRNTRSSASWQLTRARRFRTPKPQLPPPEATAPPSAAAPLARKDLDVRVNKFLTDAEIKLTN